MTTLIEHLFECRRGDSCPNSTGGDSLDQRRQGSLTCTNETGAGLEAKADRRAYRDRLPSGLRSFDGIVLIAQRLTHIARRGTSKSIRERHYSSRAPSN